MVSIFTPNINLEEPARGDDVGVWDTPVNSNMSVIDLVVGGAVGIALNNSPVVLSTPQFQSNILVFSSTLTGSVTITFPSTFKKAYVVRNACSGSSAFTVTLATTTAGGQVICAPPFDNVQVFNDGQNLVFFNLGRVGSYFDYAGSSVPAWISGCSVPPYLNCDGTAFSSATFPQLTVILGGTTLPDSRGRFRATQNQTTTRILSSNGGVDGNTNLASGGADTKTLVTANLPPYTPAGAVTATLNSLTVAMRSAATTGSDVANTVSIGNGTGSDLGQRNLQVSGANNVTGTVAGSAQGGTSSAFSVMPPTYIGGITMIRAA